MKMLKLPPWLKVEYITLGVLAAAAGCNAAMVVVDHSAWLNAGVVGASTASFLSTGTISYFIRRLRAAEALLVEQNEAIKAMMEIKTAEVGEALASHLGAEASMLGAPPRVTKH
jgi:hypothetical protein